MRRRPALVLAVVVAALGLVAAGCGGEEQQSATPETVQGGVTTPPTTGTTTTATATTATTSTGTTGTTTTQTTTSATPPAKGDPAAGKQVFLSVAACGGCHTLADAGSTGNVGPNLDDVQPTYDKVVTQVTNGGGAMPPFKDTLSAQQIADVAAYVSSVAGK